MPSDPGERETKALSITGGSSPHTVPLFFFGKNVENVRLKTAQNVGKFRSSFRKFCKLILNFLAFDLQGSLCFLVSNDALGRLWIN